MVCPSEVQSAAISPEQVYDGTQTTILFAEVAGAPDYWVRSGKKSLPTGINGYTLSNPGGCWGCFKNASNYVNGSSFAGDTKMPTGTTLCCIINCSNEASMNFAYAFHPGSAGIAMADGSAHQVSENISLVTFCNLVSYRGHESVTDNF
jgi:prepilin-type processing-associated H-X9-DG protein